MPPSSRRCAFHCDLAAGVLSRGRPLNRKLLHAPPGGRLADVEVALGVDAHAMRAQKLAGPAAAASEFAGHFGIRAPQDPNLVVRAVGEVQRLLLRGRATAR